MMNDTTTLCFQFLMLLLGSPAKGAPSRKGEKHLPPEVQMKLVVGEKKETLDVMGFKTQSLQKIR
jgi:hypothetical protein